MRRFEDIYKRGIYRSRRGAILGVCRGLAEYFDFSIFWFRAIAVMLLFLSGLWPITILYIIAALCMKPEPIIPLQTVDEKEFYDSYLYSRQGVAQRLKRKYEDIERRIRRMEHIVTEREFDWEHRMD